LKTSIILTPITHWHKDNCQKIQINVEIIKVVDKIIKSGVTYTIIALYTVKIPKSDC